MLFTMAHCSYYGTTTDIVLLHLQYSVLSHQDPLFFSKLHDAGLNSILKQLPQHVCGKKGAVTFQNFDSFFSRQQCGDNLSFLLTLHVYITRETA